MNISKKFSRTNISISLRKFEFNDNVFKQLLNNSYFFYKVYLIYSEHKCMVIFVIFIREALDDAPFM